MIIPRIQFSLCNFEGIKSMALHQLQQIFHLQPLKTKVEVFVYQDFTSEEDRFASKSDYQRSVVKQAMSLFLGEEVSINHRLSGAPFLVDLPKKKVSISHSGDYYAIQLADGSNVGVDIQLFKENLSKGSAYFVNDWEEKNLELTELNLHLIWSAKEATYKLLDGLVEKYKEDITIKKIGKNQIEVLTTAGIIYCNYKCEKHFVLVYTAS